MVSGAHDAHDEGVTIPNAADAAGDGFIDRAAAQLVPRPPRGAVMRAPDALGRTTREAECARHARNAESAGASPAKSHVLFAVAELARVRALLAADDIRSSREWAVRILARAEGDRTTADAALPAALGTLGLIAWDGGRVADALELMRAATRREDCDVAGYGMHPRLSLVAMLAATGSLAEAERALDDDDTKLDRACGIPWQQLAAVLGARLRLDAGQLDDAEQQITFATPLARDFEASFLFSLSQATLAEIALRRGAIVTAHEHVSRCDFLPPLPRVFVLSTTLRWVRARVAYARGGAAAAVAAISDVYDDLGRHKALLLTHAGAAAWLVRTALAANEEERATAVVLTAAQLASDNGSLPATRALAAHARGVFAHDAEALRSAADDAPTVWARASAQEDAGSVEASMGNSAESASLFERAEHEYNRAGAVRDAERARARSRAQISSKRRGRTETRPTEGWASLTESERRVVDLVAQGMTNRQAAASAYLSRHTIDFHLRQAFHKLNVSSRVALTRVAIEQQAHTRNSRVAR